MSKVAELTVTQFRQLIGKTIVDDWTFNPTVMADGRFFLSKEEIDAYQGQDYAYIKSLPLIDFTNTIPDTTPPQMSGYGILIPQKYIDSGLFPNDKFELNGFVVELTSTNQGLAVDVAYLGWQQFKDEQDRLFNQSVKNSLSVLWYDIVARYYNNEIIQL